MEELEKIDYINTLKYVKNILKENEIVKSKKQNRISICIKEYDKSIDESIDKICDYLDNLRISKIFIGCDIMFFMILDYIKNDDMVKNVIYLLTFLSGAIAIKFIYDLTIFIDSMKKYNYEKNEYDNYNFERETIIKEKVQIETEKEAILDKILKIDTVIDFFDDISDEDVKKYLSYKM